MSKALTTPRQLPSLNDLYNDVELAAKQNDLNRLLNCEPKKEWIKDNPIAQGTKYIPISIVEYLLTSIFIKWRVEIKETKVIANAIQVTVRLHVQDPITMEWDWQDGIGAAPIQTAKGAAATDFAQVVSSAIVKAAPAAKSYAIKDAAECLGRIFGKDLNRKEFLPYTNLDGKIDLSTIPANQEQINELYTLLLDAKVHFEEFDEFQTQIASGLSIDEYHALKMILIDRQQSALTRLRNGDSLSQKEISQAVNERVG